MATVVNGEAGRLGGKIFDVAVNGGTLRVESRGEGPAVMLVHGWTLDCRIWAPQVDALAAGWRLIAFDRRGFGQSSAPPDPAQEPNDIAAITRALGIRRLALVGMSQGARVALAFAMRRPERVWALAVQGAPLSGVGEPDEAIPLAAMTAAAAEGRLGDLRRLWRAHPLMRVRGARANRSLDAIVQDYMARDLLAPGRTLAVGVPDLARLPMPVLTITGAEDSALRHRVADILVRTTGGERVDIDDAGHLCNLCRPDAYNAALAGFLERHGKDIRCPTSS